MPAHHTEDVHSRPPLTGRTARQGWSRKRVITVLLIGTPLVGLFCLLVQWPLWAPGDFGLAAANFLVTITFYATSVFVSAEPGHRLTGAGLAAAAFLWPVIWVNEWRVGPLPLLASLEGPLPSLLAVWALLRYPAPWPRRRYEAATVAILLLMQGPALLQVVTSLPQWQGLPRGAIWLSWWPSRGAYALSSEIYDYGGAASAAAAAIALTIRLALVTGPDRRVMRPVLVAIAVAGTLTVASNVVAAAHMPMSTLHALYALEGAALVGVPLAFLVASARRWLARERVPRLIRELGSSPTARRVQNALRNALADPSLRLLYQVDEGFVDTDGVPQPAIPLDDPRVAAVVPTPSTGRVIMLVTANPLLTRYQDVVEAAARAATLALENTGLQAAISAQIHHVAQSTQRLTAAVNAERRRIQAAVDQICGSELATLASQLGELGQNPGAREFATHLDSARAMFAQAQGELTRLALGIGPAELTKLGLAQAVTEAAHRLSPNIAVSVTTEPLPPDVQAAAYFVLCELMTNAVKHACNSTTEVTATLERSMLALEVTDTGPGGADPNGSGLRGVEDRVTSLSGSLTVSSAPERGTRVTVRLPVPAGNPATARWPPRHGLLG